MTKEQVKAKLDELLGMESVLVSRYGETHLEYRSANGFLLGRIGLTSGDGERWSFGGTTTFCPESWETLCRVGGIMGS